MRNSILVTCLVAVIAMLLGIIIWIKFINGSVSSVRFVSQQQEMLNLQSKISNDLGVRLAAIDKKLESISSQLQKMPTAAAPQFGPPPEDLTKVYNIPVGNSPIRGKANYRIMITGFLDLQCPFSSRFQPVIDQVLAAYPGRVSYIIKHFPLPFHERAKPAAKAVLAAGEQGKYWEMVNLILKDNQNLSEDKLREFAKSIKLDMKRFEKDLKSKDVEWENLIQADFELGRKADVRGTPTYYLNGRKTMSRDLESFKKEIDIILQKQ